MNYRNVFWSLVFCMLILKAVYAQIDIISYTNAVAFSNEEVKTLSISFACHKPNASVTDAIVKFDSFAPFSAVYNGAYYTSNVQIFNIPSNYGNKSLMIYCSYSDGTKDNKTIHVVVNKIDLKIDSPTFSQPLDVYQGSYVLSMEASLSSYIPGIDSYSLRNIKLILKSPLSSYRIDNPLLSYDNGKVNVIFYVPYTIKEGIYDIILNADYPYYDTTLHLTAKSPRSLYIKSPLSIKLISPQKGSTIKLESSKNVVLKFKVYDKGDEIIDMTNSNFKFLLGDKVLSSDVSYDSAKGYYVATVNLIKCNEDNKSNDVLKMQIVNYNNYPALEFNLLNVEYVVSLKGTTLTRSGKVINAKFTLENKDKIYAFTSDNKGDYNILVPKGTYNVTLLLNDRDKIIFYDVKIDNNENNFIKIDYPDITTSNLRVIKTLVVEIANPYSYAKAKIYYDDRKILDERNMLVRYCDYWNFGLGKCGGNLRSQHYDINIISNIISIDDFKGNAIISEKKKLFINLEAEKDSYFVGDEVKVTGFVKDYDGNPQGNVKVYYTLEGTSIQGSVKTQPSGRFEIDFNVPKIKSRYEEHILDVFIPDNSISSENKSLKFTFEKRIKLVAYVDDIINVKKGEEKEIPIKISNEGDLDLTNLEIRIAGLKEDWYTFTPSFIETLKAGESANIKMLVKINCKKQECKDYYFVNMRIKSDETTDDVSFTIHLIDAIKGNTTSLSSAEESTDNSSSLYFSKLTGKISQININSSNINYYLIIGFFIAAFILITIKKRSRRKAFRRPLLRRRF